MTALCGLARNFGQLFLARVGVGVGEAALTPAAFSVLGDYFKGPALTRALSVYTSAIYLGAGLALMIGGAVIASVKPMRAAGARVLRALAGRVPVRRACPDCWSRC